MNGRYAKHAKSWTGLAVPTPPHFLVHWSPHIYRHGGFADALQQPYSSCEGLWGSNGCIPMGGFFFAQAAHLHSLWKGYTDQTPPSGKITRFMFPYASFKTIFLSPLTTLIAHVPHPRYLPLI